MAEIGPGVFLEALRQVFDETGIRLDTVARRRTVRSGAAVEQVVASVGVTGAVRCNLMLCADNSSADGILRGMTAGVRLPAGRLGDLPRAAMGEIANQVAGRAVTLLAARGRRCDITPPTVIAADRIDSLLTGPAAAWTVRGDFGVLRLVAAQERRKSS